MPKILSGKDAENFLKQHEDGSKRVLSGKDAEDFLKENEEESILADIGGKAKSAAVGFAQGATAENAPDILSALQAAGSAVTRGPKGVLERYKEFKKYNREQAEKSKKENPKIYETANLAGNVGLSMALPESKAAQYILPAALQGFGQSKKSALEEPIELAKETATSGAVGGVLGKTIEKGGELTKKIGKELYNRIPHYAYDIPNNLSEKYYKYSGKLPGSKDSIEFSKELSKQLPQLGKKASELSGESYRSLTEPVYGITENIDPKSVSNVFMDILKGIEKREQGISTDEPTQNAKKFLYDLMDKYQSSDSKIGLDRIKDEVLSIDKKIKWDKKQGLPQDEKILREARSGLNSILKENEKYNKIIPEVREYTQLSKKAEEKFGKEFKEKDVLSGIKELATGGSKDPEIVQAAENIGKKLGIDIKEASEIASIKDAIKDSNILGEGNTAASFIKGLTIKIPARSFLWTRDMIKESSKPAADMVKNFSEYYKDKTPEMAQLGIDRLIDLGKRGNKEAVLALQIMKNYQGD